VSPAAEKRPDFLTTITRKPDLKPGIGGKFALNPQFVDLKVITKGPGAAVLPIRTSKKGGVPKRKYLSESDLLHLYSWNVPTFSSCGTFCFGSSCFKSKSAMQRSQTESKQGPRSTHTDHPSYRYKNNFVFTELHPQPFASILVFGTPNGCKPLKWRRNQRFSFYSCSVCPVAPQLLSL